MIEVGPDINVEKISPFGYRITGTTMQPVDVVMFAPSVALTYS